MTHVIVKSKSPSTLPSSSSKSSSTPYSITHYVNCEKFYDKHRKFLAVITAWSPPKSFKEAMKYKGWRKAMAVEIKALQDQGTCESQPLPPGKKALGSKQVYKDKYDAQGKLQRLKAGLVIFGHHQVEGIDYDETFTLVEKLTMICTFLAIATIKKRENSSDGYT